MTVDERRTTTTEREEPPELFSDAYFSRGHWLLKIRQTLVGLLGWVCAIVPLVMTYFILTRSSLTFFGHTVTLTNGVFTVEYLAILLLFCFATAGVLTVTMTLIQNRKRQRIVQEWPTYDPLKSARQREALEDFMTQRFGPQQWRENVRSFVVTPDKNLETDTLSDLTRDIRKEDDHVRR